MGFWAFGPVACEPIERVQIPKSGVAEMGALEWVRPERGAQALESVAVPAASGELSLALENPGERV